MIVQNAEPDLHSPRAIASAIAPLGSVIRRQMAGKRIGRFGGSASPHAPQYEPATVRMHPTKKHQQKTQRNLSGLLHSFITAPQGAKPTGLPLPCGLIPGLPQPGTVTSAFSPDRRGFFFCGHRPHLGGRPSEITRRRVFLCPPLGAPWARRGCKGHCGANKKAPPERVRWGLSAIRRGCPRLAIPGAGICPTRSSRGECAWRGRPASSYLLVLLSAGALGVVTA